MIVLDEADKLFEAGKGFLEQIDAVFAACSECKSLVRGLFSATLPEWVEQVASSVLQEPTSIVIGGKNAAATTVKQSLQFVGKV
jgi:ATP-dependent RNA helicase DDX52/ROK1